MERASVLLLELDPGRRRSLGLGLAAEGYEVVPAVDLEEGLRFAEGLGPAVIVAPLELVLSEERRILDSFSIHDAKRTLIVLGRRPEEEELVGDDALFLAAGELAEAEIVRRIRLALVGRTLGLDPDLELQALLGDLTLLPLLDLVRRIHDAGASAVVELDGGVLHLADGALLAATAGPAEGLKAFCRLARRTDGPFRVIVGRRDHERQLEEPIDSLIHAAIRDALGEFPDPRTRFVLAIGPGFFEQPFSPAEQLVLSQLGAGATLRRVLDEVPLPDGEVVRKLLELEHRGVVERREPVPAVAVVTDSTADLPAEVLREHAIRMVPLTIHFGDEALVDREELAPGEFYRLLEEHGEHPSTRPPPPERFALEYERCLARQDVVSLHISEAMSQTVVNARRAARRQRLEGLTREGGGPARLEVVDSRQVSLPLGLLALFAARMAARGLEAGEIVERGTAIAGRLSTFFVVDTLEYLARGGRIGRARAWFGQLIGIKPILGVEEGEVVPVDRVRGGRAAQPRLIELAAEILDATRPTVAGIAHAKAPVWADRLRGLVEERFRVAELYVAEMGPVVGTHVGPGAVGATFFQPTDEEAPLVAPLADDS